MKTLALMIFGSALCLAQPVSSGGRSMEGTLRGSDGTPLAGGNVSLHRLPPYPATSRTTQWRTTSGAQGAFRFDGLADGQYQLCGHVPSGIWLNPCEWGKRPSPISMRADQRATLVTLMMVKGAAVPIRIDDPGKFLPLHEGKTAGAHVLLGVGNDALAFAPALIKNREDSVRDYAVVIPLDVPVKLVVNSAFFQLSDSGGLPLSRTGSTQIPLLVLSGQNPATVRLIVTGATK